RKLRSAPGRLLSSGHGQRGVLANAGGDGVKVFASETLGRRPRQYVTVLYLGRKRKHLCLQVVKAQPERLADRVHRLGVVVERLARVDQLLPIDRIAVIEGRGRKQRSGDRT